MKEFTFDGQRADEVVEEVVRNHPYILLWPGIKCVVVLALPVAALIFLGAGMIFSIAAFAAILISFAIFGKAWYHRTVARKHNASHWCVWVTSLEELD